MVYHFSVGWAYNMIIIKMRDKESRAKGQPKLYCDNSYEDIIQLSDTPAALLALRVKAENLAYSIRMTSDTLNKSITHGRLAQ